MTKPEQIFEAIGIGMGLDQNAIKNQFKEFTKNYTSNTSTYSGYVLDPPQNP